MKWYNCTIPQFWLPYKLGSFSHFIAFGLLAGCLILPISGFTATIKGTIFIDSNGNGVQDNGELPIKGQAIAISNLLSPDWSPLPSYSINPSNEAGYYEFRNLPAGTFNVARVASAAIPDDWVLTTSDTMPKIFSITSDETIIFNLGYRKPNHPPVLEDTTNITAHGGTGRQGARIIVRFTDSDIEDTHTCQWSFADVQEIVVVDAEGYTCEISRAYDLSGIHDVELTVKDNNGGSQSKIFEVTIPNTPPIVSYYGRLYHPPSGFYDIPGEMHGDRIEGYTGTEYIVTGVFYDPDKNDTHTFEWDFGDGTKLITHAASWEELEDVAHTFLTPGNYDVILKVTDSEGNVGIGVQASFELHNRNIAPIVEVGKDITVEVGETITFKGSYTDPDFRDDNVSSFLELFATFIFINWDFGDGNTIDNTPDDYTVWNEQLGIEEHILSPSHIYDKPGTYTVKLSVSDGLDVGEDKIVVTVNTNTQEHTLVKLSATPSSLPVCEGKDFDVTFSLDIENPETVDASQVYISFDPAVLRANSLNTNMASGLDFALDETIDNSSGQIQFSAMSLLNDSLSGNADLFTVNFTALKESNSTTLKFDPNLTSSINGTTKLTQLSEDLSLETGCPFEYPVLPNIAVDDASSQCIPGKGYPPATSGFIAPLPYEYKNNGGYEFEQEAEYSGGTVHHPGEDWNVPNKPGGPGDGDKGLTVVAVANGLVVYSDGRTWGGVVIEHNYQGKTWYSQYGHVQNIIVNKGDIVSKGDKIAEIGNVGSTKKFPMYAHLHFEIRTSEHPDPCRGSYWSYGSTGLANLDNVKKWYADPDEFIPAHPEYAPLNISIVNKENGDIKISGANLGTGGTITVDGKVVQGQWTSDGVTLNVGVKQDSLVQPLQIKVTDNSGKEIASVCYPFIDVCPRIWFTHPTTLLWKKDILGGYSGVNDKSQGYFKPYNGATRAEFIATLVRALEQEAPTPLTSDPFADVGKDTWYAPYIDYAKKLGLIQGCDRTKNLFCPDKTITRAEAIKVLVLAYPHLEKLQGKVPTKIYSDVTDKQQWYYPYIYAAQAANVIGGYPDGTFRPNQPMNRAEMAKIICVAEYGVAACIESGENKVVPIVLPRVSSVSPLSATLGQVLKLSVIGENLTDTTALWIANCTNVVATGGTAQKRNFECTPSNDRIGLQEGVVKDKSGGTVLLSFNVDVKTTTPPPVSCTPKVSSVSPLRATLNQSTTFIVNGSCLPETTAFWIGECANLVSLGGSETQRQYQCTPSYSSGIKEGVIKDKSNGTVLLSFNVDVQQTTTPPPVSCTPKVSSVSPLGATFNQSTTFIVNGSCLPKTTAFWIGECASLVSLGGSETQRQYQCTPSYSSGIKEGVVKDKSDGMVLLSFNVDVKTTTPPPVSCTPKVSSVSPLRATLDESATFTVNGSCLPETTAFWIGECANLVSLGGTATQRKFQCTPSYTIGSKEGLVKDKPNGTVLLGFSLDVVAGTPKVTAVSPLTAKLNQSTIFTVKGSNLPGTTAFFIPECANPVNLSGSTTERRFQCTPSYTTGSKSGVVKDKSGGSTLHSFSVAVQ